MKRPALVFDGGRPRQGAPANNFISIAESATLSQEVQEALGIVSILQCYFYRRPNVIVQKHESVHISSFLFQRDNVALIRNVALEYILVMQNNLYKRTVVKDNLYKKKVLKFSFAKKNHIKIVVKKFTIISPEIIMKVKYL